MLDVGSEVSSVGKGDSVVLSYNFCNSCHSCKIKRTWHCSEVTASNFGGCRPDGSRTVMSQGEPISTCFFGQSSFCNPTIVQEVCCVKVDGKLPLSVVCALGCGFQTGAGAVCNVVKPVARGIRSLAVFGVGGVGCAAIMMARYLAKQTGSQLKTIIAIDVNEQRLDLAKELGATHAIDSTKANLNEVLDEITVGEQADAAVDCTGVVSVIEQMIKLIGPGGLAVTIGGPPPGSTAAVDVFGLLIKAASYRGCHQGNAYSREVSARAPHATSPSWTDLAQFIPMLASLYEQGELPLEKLQKTFKASDINLATEQMSKGLVIKPVLLWDAQ